MEFLGITKNSGCIGCSKGAVSVAQVLAFWLECVFIFVVGRIGFSMSFIKFILFTQHIYIFIYIYIHIIVGMVVIALAYEGFW